MTSGRRLRIGTRRSALALAQAHIVERDLERFGVTCEIVPMTTRGDGGVEAPLGERGVKGLFVDEIEHALREGVIDMGVHSAKDLPATDDHGLAIAAVPKRVQPFDVLVSRESTLPDGARVATSSLRRRAQLMRSGRSVEVVEIRGNVDTRLRRMREGDVDALVLAQAGLERLGLTPEHMQVLEPPEMVPAPGQGFLAIQTRTHGDERALVARLDHASSRSAWLAERTLVKLLGADCALPVGAFARAVDDSLVMDAVVLSQDGDMKVEARTSGPDPLEVAEEAAETLIARGADALLAPYIGSAAR